MADGLTDLLGDLSDDQPVTGGQLRKQLEAVLAQNKALTDQLAAQTATQRQSAVEALFTKHGVPGVAKDLFSGEPTDESVTEFVSKYGAMWGATAAPATTAPAEQAATNALQGFAAQTSTATAAPLSEDEYRAKFAEAKNQGELDVLIAQLSGLSFG